MVEKLSKNDVSVEAGKASAANDHRIPFILAPETG